MTAFWIMMAIYPGGALLVAGVYWVLSLRATGAERQDMRYTVREFLWGAGGLAAALLGTLYL